MKMLVKASLVVAVLALLTVTPTSSAKADHNPYWRGYWGWYDNTYQPYYNHYYSPQYYGGPVYGGGYYSPGYSGYYGPGYGGYYAPGVGVQIGRARAGVRFGWW